MSEPLSNPPQRRSPSADAGGAGATALPCQVISQQRWEGVELLYCREDIRRPTEWRIGQARHTLIVHLGGTMRRLETRIDGVGALHGPPAPGDIWLIPAQQQYLGQAQGQMINYAELRISPEARIDLPDGNGIPLCELAPRMGHRDEFLYQAVSQLVRLGMDGADLPAMMGERLQRVLRQHLFHNYRGQPADPAAPRRPGPSLSPMQARRLDEYIRDNLDRPITLQALAAEADMTVHQLLPAFRRVFGLTPAKYVMAQRLREARARLLNGNQDIADIAAACGFASHSHLSAAFKRDLGISPRQFREGLRTLALP